MEGNPDFYYANYKVELTATLYQDGQEVDCSSAHDFIIYTNAKIIPELITTIP